MPKIFRVLHFERVQSGKGQGFLERHNASTVSTDQKIELAQSSTAS